MKGKKRLSPFEKLQREIEGLLDKVVYESQLNALYSISENKDFLNGQVQTLRYLLERSYAIYNSRSMGIELSDMSIEEWQKEYYAHKEKEG